jgi:hypothetical protein
MVWAFTHSGNPVFPLYVRGVELTVAGMALGVAFLRLGIVACMVAHFVGNAVQGGMPLLISGNTTYVLSGVLAMTVDLTPRILALISSGRSQAESRLFLT